jgi:hypothetical protein
VRTLALFAALLVAAGPATTAPPAAPPPGPGELAKSIDRHLAAGWKKADVKPAPAADDATFARRVYLDLLGRIPTVAEARAFITDRSPDRRTKLIDRLLASGGHNRHAATFWRRTWVPQADTPQFTQLAEGFEEWIASRLAKNAPYDQLVRQMLVVTPNLRRVRGQGLPDGEASRVFVLASESKPENLAANTARAFLGINLDCAQCHDHPFAKWTRKQFWETAAFFATPTEATDKKPARLELTIPSTTRVIPAAFLTDDKLTLPARLDLITGPKLLAEWTTSKDNPYFARNAVNRVWAELMGTGLVEPLDDVSVDNAPSHPALLDELAGAFAASGYDLKYLTKAIALTRAYQLASVPEAPASTPDPRLFARMPVRGLTGEQLYDSLRVAAGLPVERDDLDPVNATRERKQFAAQFLTERAATAQRSIIQSLALMNGPVTEAMTSPAKTPILASTTDAPFLDRAGKVEALFLAALGRRPTPKESSLMAKHLAGGGSYKDPAKALADVFWALLNSSEFSTNH